MSLRQMLLFSAQGMTSSIISAPLASNPSSAAILSTLTVSKQAISLYHFGNYNFQATPHTVVVNCRGYRHS